MKPQYVFENSGDRASGIFLEIREPNSIALPIPPERSPANLLFSLCLYLTNQTLKPWKINSDSTIVAELINSEGNTLEEAASYTDRGNNLNQCDRGYNFMNKIGEFISNLIQDITRRGNSWVSPKESICIFVTAEICQKKDYLQLILFIDRYPYKNIVIFDRLKPEDYQLRFIYRSQTDRTQSQRLTKILQATNTRRITGDRLVTPFVNLRLLESKTNDKRIEVDGIEFKTLLPETTLSLPKHDNSAEKLVKIGIQINNNHSTDFYFNFYSTLIPTLIHSNGLEIPASYSTDILQTMVVSDLILADSGKTITFFPHAKLSSHRDGRRLKLKIDAGDGGDWTFFHLNPGQYFLRLTYKNRSVETTVYDPIAKQSIQFQNLWKGMVLLPLVALNLERQSF